MLLTSPDFNHEEMIPKKFTCQGANINPKLKIANIPAGTKSLVLIIDDPDAPGKIWVHWVVFNIPVTNEIAENSVPGKQGSNDFKTNKYGGPCPPTGIHRYFFKIYALDTLLSLNEGASKEEVERAMKGHILSQTELIGIYKKS